MARIVHPTARACISERPIHHDAVLAFDLDIFDFAAGVVFLRGGNGLFDADRRGLRCSCWRCHRYSFCHGRWGNRLLHRGLYGGL